MDFIAKHALGPFNLYEDDDASVSDKYGVLICECYGSDTSSDENNAKLFAQTHAMLEYMMSRAKALHDMLLWQPNWEGKPVPWQGLELDKILAILKDAGVEAVE